MYKAVGRLLRLGQKKLGGIFMLDMDNMDKREMKRLQELLFRIPILGEDSAEMKMIESFGQFLSEKGNKSGNFCFNLCMYNLGKLIQMLSVADECNGYASNDTASKILTELDEDLKDRADLIKKLDDYDCLASNSAFRYGFYAGVEAKLID
jgi:hypothetical protein